MVDVYHLAAAARDRVREPLKAFANDVIADFGTEDDNHLVIM
jgi:hypothetical protein